MRSAGDEDLVGSEAHPDEGADRSTDDALGGGAFDPGIETGYLRRAARKHDLDPTLGARSFDPGDAAGYDERRARREEKRRARVERERRQQLIEDPGPTRLARGSAAPALEPEPLPDPEPAPRPKPIPVEKLPADLELDEEPRQVAELRALRPQRRSLAERLEREREERRRAERERRARIELERAERERAEREKLERRRREREERLRRDRRALRRTRPIPGRIEPARPVPGVLPPKRPSPTHPRPARRPAPAAGGSLIWPTAKAGFAVTLMLALAGVLGSVLGLPVPALDKATGDSALVSSATLFGVGPGTPPGMEGGYVFPVGGAGPANYGEKAARFGADRYGHTHQGQDVFANPGTALFAVRDGVVIDGASGRDFYAYGGGHAIVIYSPSDDRSYVYLHMRTPTHLHAGDQVRAGQRVGEVGCTGSCDGPHLHFEIREGKVAFGQRTRPVDPLPYLQQWERFGAQ